MPFCWNLSRVSLMVGLGLLVWDRKIMEKVTFHPMSQRVHTCSVLYHHGRWPWSPGRSGVHQVSSLWSYSFTLLFTLSSFQKVLVHVVVQSLTHVWLFCSPMGCSLPGSSDHGISQIRILEWVAISYSRGSSWPRDRTCISWILYHWATREA